MTTEELRIKKERWFNISERSNYLWISVFFFIIFSTPETINYIVASFFVTVGWMVFTISRLHHYMSRYHAQLEEDERLKRKEEFLKKLGHYVDSQ